MDLLNLRIPDLKILLMWGSTFENCEKILELKITKLTFVGGSKQSFIFGKIDKNRNQRFWQKIVLRNNHFNGNK